MLQLRETRAGIEQRDESRRGMWPRRQWQCCHAGGRQRTMQQEGGWTMQCIVVALEEVGIDNDGWDRQLR